MNNSNARTSIATRTAEIFLRPDGILQVDSFLNAEVSLQDALECIHAQASLAAGKKLPVLVKMGSVRSIDQKARGYFGSEEAGKNACAVALVIRSSIDRVIGNFMIGLNNSIFPTRLFTSEQEAVNWLREYLR